MKDESVTSLFSLFPRNLPRLLSLAFGRSPRTKENIIMKAYFTKLNTYCDNPAANFHNAF